LKKGLDPEALTGKYPVRILSITVCVKEKEKKKKKKKEKKKKNKRRGSRIDRVSFFLQPKIQVASKYERRVDTRSYDDKKKLFEGVSMLDYFSIFFIR